MTVEDILLVMEDLLSENFGSESEHDSKSDNSFHANESDSAVNSKYKRTFEIQEIKRATLSRFML